MIIEIQSPPRTIMEVYKMLPEGTLAEIINGQIYMSPAPNTNHQRISGKIQFQLTEFTQNHSLGEIFDSPYDVYLDETANAVQPDIVFVANSNASIVKAHGIVGTPDLIVEFHPFRPPTMRWNTAAEATPRSSAQLRPSAGATSTPRTLDDAE